MRLLELRRADIPRGLPRDLQTEKPSSPVCQLSPPCLARLALLRGSTCSTAPTSVRAVVPAAFPLPSITTMPCRPHQLSAERQAVWACRAAHRDKWHGTAPRETRVGHYWRRCPFWGQSHQGSVCACHEAIGACGAMHSGLMTKRTSYHQHHQHHFGCPEPRRRSGRLVRLLRIRSAPVIDQSRPRSPNPRWAPAAASPADTVRRSASGLGRRLWAWHGARQE